MAMEISIGKPGSICTILEEDSVLCHYIQVFARTDPP